ncbi:invasion associated locus B family protein [Parvibaculum sp.]|uniref:invasion associated locus B family protein n=1 Tax=Parvibaculum sp. TaxID=2024848 RepID=UPI002CB45DC5|nr:invasion associated locus B family protein [Parvibaculum sp.]HUD50149.1 invasion associated locus B family protein [Parvibaculum sp.]
MFFRRVALGALLLALGTPLAPALAADAAKPAAPAASEPKPEIKKYGSWATRCEVSPKDPKQKECFAFVDVRIEDGKQRVLYFGVGYIPKKTDGSMFVFAIVPLGTVLPAGLGVNVDNSPKPKFGGPYIFCIPLGCQAEMPLSAENLKALKGGKEMEVLFKHAAKGDIKVPVKLDGFGAAIAALPKPKA